jgi:PKD repeat protein
VVSETLHPTPGQIEVAQINMNTDGGTSNKKPKIIKMGRGNITPSVTTSGKSSGGSSSSKTATKNKKVASEESDFYHDINREIDRLTKTTDKLADAKDRAFGDDKIKNLNAEIAAIEKEIKAQEKLIARAK